MLLLTDADKALLAAVAQEGFQMLHHTLETVLHKAPLDPLKRLQEVELLMWTLS